MGKEIRPSPNGMKKYCIHWFLHWFVSQQGEINQNLMLLLLFPSLHPSIHPSIPSVWCRGAVRREERRTDRQDVRLSPGSFLQLFPAEVLMSLNLNVALRWDEQGKKKLSLDSFVIIVIFFYNTAEEQVRWLPNPYEKEL